MGGIGDAVGGLATGGLSLIPNAVGGLMDSAAGQAGIANPVTQEQLGTAYNNTQTGLSQQQAFLQALQAQNGIQNQSNIYNQLGQVAQGQGPNPAQAQLANATGANVANQAALAAGQRGASQNVGMIARQAGQQGGNIQQQAAGQGAALQAQQSLNALGQQGNMAGQMVGNQANANQAYSNAALQQQQNLLGGTAAYNNAAVANQTQSNQGRTAILGGIMSGAGAGAAAMSDERLKTDIHPADDKIKQFLDNAGSHEYTFKPGAPDSGTHVSPMAQELEKSELGKQMVQNTPQGKMVDYGKGFGTIVAAQAALNKRLEALEGGRKMADGGEVKTPNAGAAKAVGDGLKTLGASMTGGKADIKETVKEKKPTELTAENPNANSGNTGNDKPQDPGVMYAADGGMAEKMRSYFSKGGEVKAMLSPGEAYIPPKNVKAVAKGADPKKAGKMVPGKAKVKGDSEKNDTVPAKLKAGGVVIPRTVMNAKDHEAAASKFVQAVLAKGSLRGKK